MMQSCCLHPEGLSDTLCAQAALSSSQTSPAAFKAWTWRPKKSAMTFSMLSTRCYQFTVLIAVAYSYYRLCLPGA